MVSVEAPATPPELGAEPSPLAALRERARKLVRDADAARAHLAEVHREGQEDEEAIHDFRVALRRLRSALRPLGLAWGKRKTRALAERLRTIVEPTGELRDEEVLRETLATLRLRADVRAALTVWQVGRARRERGLRSRVVNGLSRSDDLSQILQDIDRLVSAPAKRELPEPVLARDALARALRKLLDRALTAVPDDKLAMHDVRIAAKQLRYAAELFEGLVDVDCAAVAKSGAKLQKRLGHLHDLDEAKLRMGRAYGLVKPARDEVLAAIARERSHVEKKAVADLDQEVGALGRVLDPEPTVSGP